MSGGIAEFLSELNEIESLAALRKAHSQRSALVFKVDTHPNPIKASIDNFLDKKAILTTDISDLKLPDDKEVSIKFNVGTEVFFVKTFIKSHMNRYYFDMASKVIQLKRRKEPRFIIPTKWPQTAGVYISDKTTVDAKVVDISLSGIRLEISPGHPPYKRDDILKIKFQVYKRAEVQTSAAVRFILSRPNMNTIVGLEFYQISDVQKERCGNIIEDINLYNSAVKT